MRQPLTRSQYAYKALKECILSGDLLPGEKIDQILLSKKLGISGSPLREAIKQLVGEGLIRYNFHIGAEVNIFSKKELEDIFEVRLVLGIYAIKHSLPKLNETDISTLQEIQQQMSVALKNCNYNSYGTLNRNFHDTIYSHCANNYLMGLLQRATNLTQIAKKIFKGSPNRMRTSNIEHFEILEAIKNKDLKKTTALLLEHKKSSFKLSVQEYCKGREKMNEIIREPSL